MKSPACRIGLAIAVAAAWPAVAGSGAAGAASDAAATMLRRLFEAPEATASVILERSDPFGGPPERERGRVWFIPGRGLRYKAEDGPSHEIAVDRVTDRVLLFRPSEPHLYEGAWAKAPSRLRQLVSEPERVLRRAGAAEPETRQVRGDAVAGWRLRAGSAGDSAGRSSVWVSGGSEGLPRYVAVANEVDTLLVEFRGWSLRREAKPRDLAVKVPRGTPASPLDPRDLLDAAGGGGESR
jgi:hypothetical protein